jgi:hypothetical protein
MMIAKIFLKIVLIVLISMDASFTFAYVATLSWNAPTKNADGTPLSDLAGYRVYYGTSSHNYSKSSDVGSATTYKATNLQVGVPYYFAVTAYDQLGNESKYSNEARMVRYALEVDKSGTGGGTVTSSPAGINCGSNCREAYSVGTVVTLAVTSQTGSTFTGWSGDGCAGNGQCILTINTTTNVTANFSSQSSVTVTSPNGGEVIPSGSTTNIQWSASPNAVKFDLQYSMDNGRTWMSVSSNVTGTSYNWRVPVPTNNKKRCLVKVTGYNASGAKVGEDRSDTIFTIAVVKMTSPNEGETLKSGSIYTIRWTTNATNAPVAKVRLSYTTNGGSTWNLIDILTGNPGGYNWNVPDMSSNSCKIKILLKDVSGSTVGTDTNDGYFTIQP